jgi:hypothetical protein
MTISQPAPAAERPAARRSLDPSAVIRGAPPTATRPLGRHAADRPRRALQVALGVLWIADAALQYQPYMFSRDFPISIAGTALGNPRWISHSITWSAHVMAHHLVVYNAIFATVQLALGLGLLWRPTVKPALAASIGWAVLVWWFGEGLGGVLLGASPTMGAPGAVILYALIAVLVWPSRTSTEQDPPGGPGSRVAVATSGPLGWAWPRVLWVVLWASAAYLFLLPDNRSPFALHDMVTGMSPGEPGWVRAMNGGIASVVGGHGTGVSIILAVACVVAAAAVLHPALRRPGLLVAVALGIAIWMVEDFGYILTGRGTDPNTGPLLVLLAATFWPWSARAPAWSARAPA